MAWRLSLIHIYIELAPRVTRHGVLVEVYGEGILMTGDSGVGKSETAIELVKRGHRLIADDAVELKRASDKTLVGSAPPNIRHFIELRGVGIINARRIFGMGAVKQTEKVDMIIQLENWDSTKTYDRMGTANEYGDILGVQIPLITIPVKPGRNLAIIIEAVSYTHLDVYKRQEQYNTGSTETTSGSKDFNKKREKLCKPYVRGKSFKCQTVVQTL